MVDITQVVVEEAKARARERERERIGLTYLRLSRPKEKGNGEAIKWYAGTRPGMVFKHRSQCIGYYKDGAVRTLELIQEIRPMHNCIPMKIIISEIVEATPTYAKYNTPTTMPAAVN